MSDATIYFVAGERSGDNHGAALLKALRARAPKMQFLGRGGPKMRTIAGGMRDGKYRDELLQWAEEYDQWAQRAIEHVGMSFPDREPKKSD